MMLVTIAIRKLNAINIGLQSELLTKVNPYMYKIYNQQQRKIL